MGVEINENNFGDELNSKGFLVANFDKLIEGAKKGNLLDTMYPMPKELVDTTSPSSATDKPQPKVDGFDNWYDWRISNWERIERIESCVTFQRSSLFGKVLESFDFVKEDSMFVSVREEKRICPSIARSFSGFVSVFFHVLDLVTSVSGFVWVCR